MLCTCENKLEVRTPLSDLNHPLSGSYKEGWVTCHCGKTWEYSGTKDKGCWTTSKKVKK